MFKLNIMPIRQKGKVKGIFVDRQTLLFLSDVKTNHSVKSGPPRVDQLVSQPNPAHLLENLKNSNPF